MKINKVFKAFVTVIVIITVLFATGIYAQASVSETGSNCLCTSMQTRSYVRINTYSRTRPAIMRKGATKKLTYSCSANLKGKKAEWTSSNKGIVTVKDGKLIAKKKGTAIITVRIGSYSSSCTVRVRG